VQTAWNKLIERFGNEVKALIYSEPEDLKIVDDDRIVNAILAFRKGNVIIHPGGGGQYGWLELPENLKEEETGHTGQLSFEDLEKLKPAAKSKPEKKSKSERKSDKKPRKETGEIGKEVFGNEESDNRESDNRESNNKEPDDAGQRSLFDF
jgi:hypothetical protein